MFWREVTSIDLIIFPLSFFILSGMESLLRIIETRENEIIIVTIESDHQIIILKKKIKEMNELWNLRPDSSNIPSIPTIVMTSH